MPEKAIRATAQPANKMTTIAKPIAKKRSENLVMDIKILIEVWRDPMALSHIRCHANTFAS
jgi:hypothetical protein